jgi:hypothetical protein
MTPRAILTIYNSRANIYNNRYFYFSWTDITTGQTVTATNSGDNAGHIYHAMHLDCREVITRRIELPIRQFNRNTRDMPHAGCNHEHLAAYITRKLQEPTP